MRSPFPFTPVWWSENRPWKTIVSVLTPQGMVQVCGLLRRPDKFARIRDTVTDFGLPEDTFFDCALLHLLTTATLDQLRGLYPDGRFEVRRFRPNIVVETAYGDRDFVENA